MPKGSEGTSLRGPVPMRSSSCRRTRGRGRNSPPGPGRAGYNQTRGGRYIRGHVVSIGELPATKLTVEEAIGIPEIADALIQRHAREGLLHVEVEIGGGRRTHEPQRKTSAYDFPMVISRGPAAPQNGYDVPGRDRARAAAVDPFIAPWTRKLVGANSLQQPITKPENLAKATCQVSQEGRLCFGDRASLAILWRAIAPLERVSVMERKTG